MLLQLNRGAQMKTGQCALLCAPLPQPPSILYHNPPIQYTVTMVCLSCPLVSIPHPLPRPKRVGIQIPPASYSPALPTLPTNPLHLIPSVTWLGYLDGPVLWLAIYIFIYSLAIPCPHPSIMEPNKMDNLLHFLPVWPSKMIHHIYITRRLSIKHCIVLYLYLSYKCMYRIGWGKINDFDLIWFDH